MSPDFRRISLMTIVAHLRHIVGAEGVTISDAALTPREQASALRDHGAPLDAVLPLRELADIYAEIEFSPHAPSIDASDRAWTATDEVRAAFLEGVSTKERARRLVHANRSE